MPFKSLEDDVPDVIVEPPECADYPSTLYFDGALELYLHTIPQLGSYGVVEHEFAH